MSSKMLLTTGSWYSWLAISEDGRISPPFRATPVFIEHVKPLKLGTGELEVDLILLVAPARPCRRKFKLRVRYHTAELLIADCYQSTQLLGTVAFGTISLDWIRQFLPDFWKRFEPHAWDGLFNENPNPQAFLQYVAGRDGEAIIAGTTADSFDTRDPSLAGEYGVMEFSRGFDGIDGWLLLRGNRPQQMEDKWFIYSTFRDGGGLIDFRRSWTGILIWQVAFSVRDDKVETSSAKVLLDPRLYGFGSKQDEAQRLARTISAILLGKDYGWAPDDESDINAVYRDWGLEAPQQT